MPRKSYKQALSPYLCNKLLHGITLFGLSSQSLQPFLRLWFTLLMSLAERINEKRLSKDNGQASEESNETHNEYILHFHIFHKVL